MTAARPLIGITTYCRNEENHFTLPAEYVETVELAGGVPVLLAPTRIPAAEWLHRLDGIILAGGGDLDPNHYGGEAHESVYSVDAERDHAELEVARTLIASRLPTLGICRGAQVINVALGGTLIAHLPDVVGEGLPHRLPPREPVPHDVEIRDGSRLAQILGTLEIRAASWHHQALKDVPSDLNVVAHAPDGTIEAIEMPSHPWLVAVQWHPELTASDDDVQLRLLQALVKAARLENRSQ